MSDERIIRRLRDILEGLSQSGACVILLCPSLMLPEAIAKDVPVLDYPLPDTGEIELAVGTALAIVSHQLEEIVAVPSEDRENVNRALQGLSWNEIVRVVRKVGLARGKIDHTVTEALLEEKRQIIRKSEILDYIATGLRLEDVGGLNVFKSWAKTRARGFSRAAAAYGLPKPKGILFTGISGCGKSLAIQALANYWNMPLLRLDMGRVFAGIAGGPEESFRRALKTVEAVAPAILWIDEIEMGVSVFSDSIESGSTSRIFAMFLTWMQEKSAPVFVGATANDIDRLPPEFIRKGRFDEIFFVDLPNQKERHQIFKVHLTNRGKDISDISVEGLAKGTEGYSGAEIEQGIISAMYDAFAEGRELTIGDIYRALDRMVPLSVTMKEQIIKTKRWAENRAMRAN